jgi:hypothetical protein
MKEIFIEPYYIKAAKRQDLLTSALEDAKKLA